MNQALKHWREAATLIVAARNGNTVFKRAPLPFLEEKGPSWPLKSAYDYEVLLLKRSKTSSYMPSAYVFPGGCIDSSDFSSEWIEVFSNYKKSPNFGLGLVKQDPRSRPPIFATDRMMFGSPIPGEVAFRICAIRETFEESGILLVLPKGSERTPSQELTKTVHFDDYQLSAWRLRIQENPSHFIQMCQELHCLPNIWALHEWSNYLTPVTGRSVMRRRYDTAFFMCCLQDLPHTLEDQKEVTSFMNAVCIASKLTYESGTEREDKYNLI
ncbi:acyl-coenzyme A diphosphatase NUDT19-like [Lissotriton helveticus]